MIAHEVSSADEFYDRIFVRNISVTLFDDDVAQVRVARRSGNGVKEARVTVTISRSSLNRQQT